MEPTASFWDCGEYIACSYKLEVGHPPGAPFFILLGRIASLFAFGDTSKVAMMVNTLSALCSAGTVLFLFWTITALTKRMIIRSDLELSEGKIIAILGSGFIGALAFCFSESFWFSAVEGEVYAMSSFFTAVIFWAVLKWEQVADQPHADRWFILIFFLLGLAIGVHLLGILVIPCLVFIYYFKKFRFSVKGFLVTGILSLILLGIVQNVIIPGIVALSAKFELFFVNDWNLPFNSGTIIYFILIVGMIVFGILYTVSASQTNFNIFIGTAILFFLIAISSSQGGKEVFSYLITAIFIVGGAFMLKNHRVILNTILLCFTALLIGYSSFFVLIIRSQANPPIDENNPENAISLLSYLKREQYGDWPILYGQYYNTPLFYGYDADPESEPVHSVDPGDRTPHYVDSDPIYVRDEKSGKYVIADDRKDQIANYDKRFCTFFPRMWSQQSSHERAYKAWAGIDEESKKGVSKTYQSPVTGEIIHKPSFLSNLKYFIGYQVNHMFFRYFMWNFAGRQNDIQGHGIEYTSRMEGNWISGFKFIDEMRLGAQDKLPESIAKSKAHNRFYYIPLLLGLIGLFYHYFKDRENWFIVLLMFLLTGLAIVVYLNQYPYQPRERDYAYAGSTYAFAIWIGMSVYALYDTARNRTFKEQRSVITTVLGVTLVIFLAETLSGSGHAFSASIILLLVFYLTLATIMIALKKMNEKVIALVAFLLTTPSVVLLAKEGWDDHDRSNRYTCRDFAAAYLNSCAPNAILFTNGDNDTFPLWYAQEVEGIRTDVRVINLSLANTDWYIDQLRRQQYLSAPIPLILDQSKYAQGNRDFVPIRPNDKIKDQFINLKEIVNFIGSENPKDKISWGEKPINYLPTTKFRLIVDSENFVKTLHQPLNSVASKQFITADSAGTKTADSSVTLHPKILPYIDWDIGKKGYIMKNDLLILDILAANNWKRPVYFAVTVGPDAFVGLEKYFQIEGLAYRLVPYSPQSGQPRVATDVMYDVLMNRVQWGGLDKNELWMDENNMRMALTMRMQMRTLAMSLIQEGKKDLAMKVLKRALEVLPEHNVPYYYDPINYTYYLIQAFYMAGGKEDAIKLSKRFFDIMEGDTEYALSVRKKRGHENALNLYLEDRLDMMQQLISDAHRFNADELAKEFEERFKKYEPLVTSPTHPDTIMPAK